MTPFSPPSPHFSDVSKDLLPVESAEDVKVLKSLIQHPPLPPHFSDVSKDLLPVESAEDVKVLKSLIQRHIKFTGSDVARGILLNWDRSRPKFKKVFPAEYK